jgi:PhnB protein
VLRTGLLVVLVIDPADVLPTVDLPDRSRAMATATRPADRSVAAAAVGAAHVVPYLAVSDGPRALDWYAEVFGAVEQLRVVGDDGRVGHAGFAIGGADFMLSDEYPEIGVQSPASLGATTFSIHLTVADVDAVYARAVAAGATDVMAPADQPHGARHGTLVDPFGHRWMVSQEVEAVSIADYADRSQGTGFEVLGSELATAVGGGSSSDPYGSTGRGSIWAVASYADALGAVRQLVDVFGFEEVMVVTDDDGVTVRHSELHWPEGGIVQVASYDPANPHTMAPGEQSLYCVTADPMAVWRRCQAAGLEVMQEPYEPHYDPGGLGFVVRDRERNIWSFGTHGLGSAG